MEKPCTPFDDGEGEVRLLEPTRKAASFESPQHERRKLLMSDRSSMEREMSAHAPPGQLMPARDCADRLGITVAYLNHLARTGRIPRYTLGHRTHRYDFREVLSVLRGDAGQPSSAPSLETVGPPCQDPLAESIVRGLVKP